jgi:hypothetical protein
MSSSASHSKSTLIFSSSSETSSPAKQNKTKQNKTKQNKTKQNKTKQNKTEQNKTKRAINRTRIAGYGENTHPNETNDQ